MMRVPIGWLKDFVDVRTLPEKLACLLTMGGLEVEAVLQEGRETVFEINSTPNRADCLSIIGMAREAHAITGAKFRPPKFAASRGEGKMKDFAKISVRAHRACPRYSARVVRGVKIGPSPAWIVERLSQCGVRSINNVVDATNYVMLELGQPLHAFDLAEIRDSRIVVRRAGENASFTTLDGIERQLVPEDLLICNAAGPVALAGVMGGANSGVKEETVDVLLESAFFEPAGIRRTSKRLGIATESSRRFERGVDPNGTVAALHRLTEIIAGTAGGVATADWIDIYPKKIPPRRINLNPDDILQTIGVSVEKKRAVAILSSLGFSVGGGKGKSLSVRVPTFRFDIGRPIDLVEEVARINGYENIPETMPSFSVSPLVRPKYAREEDLLRLALTDAGMTEAVLYGFTSIESLAPFSGAPEGRVLVANPLSIDEAVMRTHLLPGLLDAIKLNLNCQRADCRLFAIQRVFHKSEPTGVSYEPMHVAGAIVGRRYPVGWEHSTLPLDFYDVKGIVETIVSSLGIRAPMIFERCDEEYGFLHPGSRSSLICSSKDLGFLGQLHPETAAHWDLKEDVFVFELNFEELAGLSPAGPHKFEPPSKFPFVERDISMVVENRISAAEVEKAVGSSGVALVDGVRIFDIYRGKGIAPDKKSMALTIRFARMDRTLTDEEVSAAHEKIVDMLKTKLGVELRT